MKINGKIKKKAFLNEFTYRDIKKYILKQSDAVSTTIYSIKAINF